MSVARAIVRRVRPRVRRAADRRGPEEARCRGLGAVPRRRGRLGDEESREGESRQADRADHALVHRGWQVQRPAARRARDAAVRGAEAGADGRAATLCLRPGPPGPAQQRRSEGDEQAPLDHGRRRDPEGRRRGRDRLPRLGAGRLRHLREGQEALLRLQLRRRQDLHGDVERGRARGAPRAALRVRGHGQSEPARGQGRHRGARSSTSTRSSSRAKRSPSRFL